MKIFALEKNYPIYNNGIETTLYKENPVVFTKADSSLLKDHKPFFIPDWSDDVTFGSSVVVRICRLGKNIPARFAHRYYDAVTVGIDFTARDWLRELRSKGLPWEMSKGFDGASVIGDWVGKEMFRDVRSMQFHLEVNGKTVQEGRTSDMVCKIDDAIAYISRFFTLKTGDLLFTGMPSEDDVPQIDDHFTGYVEDRRVLDFNCK